MNSENPALSREHFISILHKAFFLFGFVLFPIGVIVAQPTLQFQNFTQQDGLINNYVRSIFQDHHGFIWIGTEDGLNRFDGRHFLSYRFDPEDPESLNDNWIRTIQEDSRYQLWIGTQRGLNRLDLQSGKVERIPMIKNGLDQESLVNNIYEDPSGNLWISTLYNGVFQLGWSRENQKWISHHFPYDQSTKMEAADKLHAFYVVHAAGNELWVVNSAGIDRIDVSSGKSTRFPFPPGPDKNNQGEFGRVSGIFNGTGKIYAGYQHRLFVLDIAGDDPAKKIVELSDSNSRRTTPFSRHLLLDSQEMLLFPSYRNLALFNLESGALELIQREGQVSKHLFVNHIHAVFKDRQGNYWIGTSGEGLYLGQKKQSAFTFYRNDPTNPFSLSKGKVRSFLEKENGHLWVGILNHGLDYFIPQKNGLLKRVKSVAVTPDYLKSSNNNRVIKIIRGDQNSIWVATNNSGLIKMDSSGSMLETFIHQPNDPNSLSGNRIWGLAKDGDGYIWAGTWEDGLNRLDPRTGQVKRFHHDPKNPNSPGSNNIRCIVVNENNILWIGTTNGLTRYDPERDQFTHFRQDPDKPNSLSHNVVWAICEDLNGDLWVGTDIGLSYYNASTQTFERFFEKDGLPNNSIYGILEDDDGILWVSTRNGLARKLNNRSDLSFFPFGITDGLQTTSFLPKAHLNSVVSNQLYFGSSEGMLVVKPELLLQDSSPVEMHIHEIKRLKRMAYPNSTTVDHFFDLHEQPVEMRYEDQSLSFSIADLNWMAHPNFKYEYQLVGYNQRWMPLEEDMRVSFSGLTPGSFLLRVRVQNPEKTDLEAVDLLTLRVFPPWWRTGWAYLGYLLVAVAIIYFAVRLYLFRQLEQKEAESLRTMDAFKNKLYTDITHEFRTPLTVITGMMDQMEKNPHRWLNEGAEMVRKNGDHLLDLINQILDLQKVESGNLQLHMHLGDIIPFLDTLVEQFQGFAQSRGHVLDFEPAVRTLMMDFDEEKMLRILTNLLSNAIKYTPENGRIVVGAGTDSRTESFTLSVLDSGPGIPKDHIPYVFDRFYRAGRERAQHSIGTGIGLSLVQELVHLLNGRVEVSSKVGKGTTFTVLLPITKNAEPRTTRPSMIVHRSVLDQEVLPLPVKPADTSLPLALVVEDNANIAQYLQICLEGSYQVLWAVDGRHGIEQALEKVPDIIISDVMMPRIDGFELCEALKEDVRTSHIPIIMLTAKSDVESRIQGLKYGADDYLAKPFHEEELLVRMRNLMKIRLKLQERYKDLYKYPLSAANAPGAPKEDAFILQLKSIFEDRMHDPQFDLSALSEVLNITSAQLRRKVKALTGKPLAIYLRSLRLQKARQILLSSDLSVKEVAYDVGFSDPSYFSRSYLQEYGVRPSATREEQ